jgi:hypothetical protein
MAEPDLVAIPSQKPGRYIWWRIILGSLLALIAMTGVGQQGTSNGAAIFLIIGGALLCSGLPVKQPNWWGVTLGLILLWTAFYASGLKTVGPISIFGVLGVLLLAYGLMPLWRKASK